MSKKWRRTWFMQRACRRTSEEAPYPEAHLAVPVQPSAGLLRFQICFLGSCFSAFCVYSGVLEDMDSIPIGDFRVWGGSFDCGVFGMESSSLSSAAPVRALMLDGESGDLLRAPAKLAKKGGGGVADAKTAMALKSHSEAERRRRERINGHLTTLRRMTPCTAKLDKAGLLAEVINHIKKLKGEAVEISKLCTIPSDADELRVEVEGEGSINNSFSIKASFCCDDRPELLADIRQTLDSLQLKTIRAEISTLGGRIKFIFVLTGEGITNDLDPQLFTASIHQALKTVLDRASSPDFLPNACFSSKRRRVSPYESSSSSS